MNDVSPTRDTMPDEDRGSDVAAEQGLARGGVVGRYIVLEKVGAGGMGVVYAAYDPDLDRRVALKIVQPKRLRNPEALGRMLREAKSLAQLAHPNVVAVHDVGETKGGVFLAMEFVRGQTLSRWRAQSRPSWRECLAVMIAAGEGLAAAHDKGLVHRDIKPDNVMITPAGLHEPIRVRVMDFGLARPKKGDDSSPPVRVDPADSIIGSDSDPKSDDITRDGAIVGTPSYMAPEQFEGAPVEAAADQFAYCITLWEALYGRRPFAGLTFEAMSMAVTQGRIEPPPKKTAVPRWLHRVLLRGLSAKPDDRWPSMHALLAALADDPRPRRVRALVVAGVVGSAAAIALGLQWQAQRRAQACVDAGAAIDRTWNAEVATHVGTAVAASGIADAEGAVARVSPWLDRYAQQWRETAAEVCTASTIEARLDRDLQVRAQDCLSERAAELDEAVRLLLAPTPEIVRDAVVTASALTPVASCRDLAALRRTPIIGDDRRDDATAVRELLARASVLRTAGDPGGGLVQAQAALMEARRLDFTPLVARAHLVVGAAYVQRDEGERAHTELRTAYRLAASTGADEVAADAARRLVYVLGYQLEEREQASMWEDVATSLFDRLEYADDDPRRVELMSDRAAVRAVSGKIREARADFEEVLALQIARFGEDHPAVAQTLGALSATQHQLDDHAASEATATRTLAILSRLYGDAHPERAMVLGGYAAMLQSIGRKEESIAAARDALAILERAFGPDHPAVAGALNNLAMMIGPSDESVQLARRALAIIERARGPGHREVAYCLNNLGYFAYARKDYAEAIRDHTDAAKILEAIGD
ncbi:MAG TPA: serine/threonine-protein kinase, partial [Nannocystaceae bacterium]|nr:serine/threonine-protein kinase [Nannocystaceae bacterium]